jgi:prepilin-type N-terminal cleavage/methylation domain-containing protein
MKTRGFSLIEVLIAMSLALVLLLGTAELVTLSIWAKRKGDVTAGLCRALAARAESLKSRAFECEANGLPPGDYAESVRDEAGGGLFLQEWTVEESVGRTQRIRIKVTPAGRPASAASLTLCISTDLGFAP